MKFLRNKKIFFGILILFCIAALFYIFTQNKPREPHLITIGWIGPLSGSANFLGISNAQAIQMALEEYRTKKESSDPNIQLIVENDAYDANQSLESYHDLVTNYHPSIIFLNTYSALFTIKDFLTRDKVILVDAIDNDSNLNTLNKNIILIGKRTEQIAEVLASKLVAKNEKKAFVFDLDDDRFMPSLTDYFQKIFEQSGGTIIRKEYSSNIIDFRDSLNAARNAGADAYVFFGYQEIGVAMKQARDVGVTGQFYSANMSMIGTADKAAEGLIFPGFRKSNGNAALVNAFFSSFKTKYGGPPSHLWVAAQGYDAMNIALDALKTAAVQNTVDVDALRRVLLATNNFQGISGNVSFDPNGSSRGIEWDLYSIKNGAAVPIE